MKSPDRDAADERMAGVDETAIDEGILGVVRALRAAEVDTYSSCQGGGYQMGHGYLLPTVCFNGDDAEGERAERIATEAGYQVRQVSRTWYTRDGERFGPHWEMQFVTGAACRMQPSELATLRRRVAEMRRERDAFAIAITCGTDAFTGEEWEAMLVAAKTFSDNAAPAPLPPGSAA